MLTLVITLKEIEVRFIKGIVIIPLVQFYIRSPLKKVAEAMMIKAPDGTDNFSSIGTTVPTKHAIVTSNADSKTKLPIFLVSNRAVAPRISNNAPNQNALTIFIAAIVIKIIIITN